MPCVFGKSSSDFHYLPLRADVAGIERAGDSLVIGAFDDARAIIKGTDDTAVARSLYAKYVGM